MDCRVFGRDNASRVARQVHEGFVLPRSFGGNNSRFPCENSPPTAIRVEPGFQQRARGTTFVNDYTEVRKHDKFETGAHQDQITTRHTASVRRR